MGPLSAVRAIFSKDKEEVVQFPRLFDNERDSGEELVEQTGSVYAGDLTEVLSASMTATAAWDLDNPEKNGYSLCRLRLL